MQVLDKQRHKVEVLGVCDSVNYHLVKSKDKMKLETLRCIAHLRPRTSVIGCVMRSRNSLAIATHKYFQDLGFLYVNTPVITQCNTESTELFRVTSKSSKVKLRIYSYVFLLVVQRFLQTTRIFVKVRTTATRILCFGIRRCVHFWTYFLCRKTDNCKTLV